MLKTKYDFLKIVRMANRNLDCSVSQTRQYCSRLRLACCLWVRTIIHGLGKVLKMHEIKASYLIYQIIFTKLYTESDHLLWKSETVLKSRKIGV